MMNSLVVVCALLSFAFSSNLLVSADHPGHDERPTFCTSNVTACETSGLNITCVPPASGSSCVKDVVAKKADLASATANDIVEYGKDLAIVVGEKITDIQENFVQYYGLAVVKKSASFTFNELKGKKSCHTAVDKTVGWRIPVGYLLSTGQMTYTDNQYKSAADFFAESCVPDIGKKSEVTQEVKNDLCSLCNKTCGNDDRYYNYEGAFLCMVEGGNDRVAFVKQSTANNVLPTHGTTASDYKLLCTNGNEAELTAYKTCNIGARPASAIVTYQGKSNDMIKAYADMLKSGNIAQLRMAGIVTSNDGELPESLHEYSGTALEYVEDYKENVDALTGVAPTITVSFALQIASILAFFFIF